MNIRTMLILVATAVIGLAGVSYAQVDDPLAGIKCPVSGKPVKADAKLTYKDVDLLFCCTNCPNTSSSKSSSASGLASSVTRCLALQRAQCAGIELAAPSEPPPRHGQSDAQLSVIEFNPQLPRRDN